MKPLIKQCDCGSNIVLDYKDGTLIYIPEEGKSVFMFRCLNCGQDWYIDRKTPKYFK